MGISLDYTLRAEGTDEEVRERLERVRQRCMDLPMKAVGEVRRIEPVYASIILDLLVEEGYPLPEAVAERLPPPEKEREHALLCLTFSTVFPPELPKRELDRFYRPARELVERAPHWDPASLPEKLEQKAGGFTTLTVGRGSVEYEFANVLLRYGYILLLHPGEGSETINLALSTFGPPAGRRYRKPPFWCGQGFTKTQYAKSFIQTHETACRVLDVVQEEGLLLRGGDNVGYYKSRSWKKASGRVNEELLFAGLVGGMMGSLIGNLREEGAQVRVIEDNASTARPVDFSAALARERDAADASREEGPPPPGGDAAH